MERKIYFARSQEGTVFESSSLQQYAQEQYYEQDLSPEFAIYQILFHALKRQVSKPFQLFKQFILFSQQDSSIEAGYVHMRMDMEQVCENIYSTCEFYKKKQLMAGFISIKMLFQEKKQRIKSMYQNYDNLQLLTNSIHESSSSYLKYLSWQTFGLLKHIYYQTSLKPRLSMINISKIEEKRYDNQSKEFDEMQGLLVHRPADIEQINSIIIERGSQSNTQGSEHQEHRQRELTPYQYNQIQEVNEENYHREQIYEQHHHHQQTNQINKRHQKKQSFKGYQMEQGRLVSDRSVNDSPSIKIEEVDNHERRNRVVEKSQPDSPTHRKQLNFVEAGSTNRRNNSQQIVEPDVQQIYLIRDFNRKKKKGPPTNYVKIPLASENVKIIQIQTDKKKRRKRKERVEERVSVSEHRCQHCRFCDMSKQRQGFMDKVRRRLQVYQMQQRNGERNDVIVSQFDWEEEKGEGQRKVAHYDLQLGARMLQQRAINNKAGYFTQFQAEGDQAEFGLEEGNQQQWNQGNYSQRVHIVSDHNTDSRSAIQHLEYQRNNQGQNINLNPNVEGSGSHWGKRQTGQGYYGAIDVNQLAVNNRQSLRKGEQEARYVMGNQSNQGYEVASNEITGGYIHAQQGSNTQTYSGANHHSSHHVVTGSSSSYQVGGGQSNRAKDIQIRYNPKVSMQHDTNFNVQQIQTGAYSTGLQETEARRLMQIQRQKVGTYTVSVSKQASQGAHYGYNALESHKISSNSHQLETGTHQKEIRYHHGSNAQGSSEGKYPTTIKQVQFITHETIQSPQHIRSHMTSSNSHAVQEQGAQERRYERRSTKVELK